jgi:hypothetical protein
MTKEWMRGLTKRYKVPQSALAHLAGPTAPMLSLWFRDMYDMPEFLIDRLDLTLRAMLRLQERSGLPIDWSKPHMLRDKIEEGIAELRQERSKALRAKFEANDRAPVTDETETEPGPDICEILGTQDSGCNC